ncbi:MAG: DUF1549 domain-containing protein [Verrucomicrobiales bacterium]|nr:DUF1549 domain-containing protein [Verrucomicrobiales bacterium]
MSLARPHLPLFGFLLSIFVSGPLANGTEGFAFFEEKVRPVLSTYCYDCHSEEAGKQKGGLLLDRKEGWQTGGDSGPAIIPGDLEESILLHSISWLDDNLQMPPKRKLGPAEIGILQQWVKMGAPDPRDQELHKALRKNFIDYETARKGWSVQPHRNPPVPENMHSEWPANGIDHFILSAIESAELTPVADASPEELIRRTSFDLTGLPPTTEQVASFVKSPGQQHFAQLVDEMIASPQFGEKWGRHWLDVVRYADSNGGDRNFTYHHAWRFRNYVIDSFNKDRPYHEMVRQHIAGDLLPAANDTQRSEQLIASSFLSLGPKMLTERDKEKLYLDTADEQIDTIGRAFLGLAIGCARCHDHKFDPISQEDYYAMTGFFRSTQVILGTQNGCVNVASWVEQALPGADKSLAEKVARSELVMRLAVDSSFRQKAGGKMSLDGLPFGGVLYDETDAQLIGDWTPSTLTKYRFGEQYIHDDRKAKGKKRVVFRGSLPESGEYEVRLAYSSHQSRAQNIPIVVHSKHGRKIVELNQRKTPSVGDLFEPIGQFYFEKGGACSVTIETTGTDGYVIVDGLQFIAVKDMASEKLALSGEQDIPNGDLYRMSEKELKSELAKLLKSFRKEPLAMAPRDAEDSGDIHLRVRGEVSQPGPVIPRNFLKVLHNGPKPQIPEGSSGRVEFADWLTGPGNALLDRVMVNRIWHHLFGRGIVKTVDNFGKLGAEPTHPGLLDYLAFRFRNEGGSVKSLIREIVLSRSYQLSSQPTASHLEKDPQNATFARQNRRRLTSEEIRDSVLFLTGHLSLEKGKATSLSYGIDLDKPMSFSKNTLRTVYLPVARNNLVAEMELFDSANPDLVTGARPTTTVPTQALYLLNNQDLLKRARELAEQSMHSRDPTAWLYSKILNRKATRSELGRANSFLTELGGEQPASLGHFAHLLLISNEFLFLK